MSVGAFLLLSPGVSNRKCGTGILKHLRKAHFYNVQIYTLMFNSMNDVQALFQQIHKFRNTTAIYFNNSNISIVILTTFCHRLAFCVKLSSNFVIESFQFGEAQVSIARPNRKDKQIVGLLVLEFEAFLLLNRDPSHTLLLRRCS